MSETKKSKLSELPHTLRCSRCGKLTSRVEATKRIFNTGACGHCGGELEVVRSPSESEQR